MENRLSIRGNSVEPVLLMFPIGLLAVAVVLDVFSLLGGPRMIGTLAYCTMVGGLLSGMATALVIRLAEFIAGDRAQVWPATRRFLLDMAVLVVFAVVLLVRTRTPERISGPGLLLIELAGLSLAVVAGVVQPAVRRAKAWARPIAGSSGADEALAGVPAEGGIRWSGPP